MILFIYPYKRASVELQYSLRSLEKHFKDPFEVLIIGQKPLKPINNVKYTLISPDLKATTEQNLANVWKHILNSISNFQDILWINDDTYLLQDIDYTFFDTIYCVQDMNGLVSFEKHRWNDLLWDTFEQVQKYGFRGYNYETHMPYKFNLKNMRMLCSTYPILKGQSLVASAYFNTFFKDTPKICNCCAKFYSATSSNKILSTDIWLNHNKEGFTKNIKQELKLRFSEPSRFEIPLSRKVC